MFSVNNRNRAKSKICLKLTIKTPERRRWLTPFSSVSAVNFEEVNPDWVDINLFLVNVPILYTLRTLARNSHWLTHVTTSIINTG